MEYDADYLFSFLRLDKSRIELEKFNVVFNDKGLQLVELTYYDRRTRDLRKCCIGVGGAKIDDGWWITTR